MKKNSSAINFEIICELIISPKDNYFVSIYLFYITFNLIHTSFYTFKNDNEKNST